MPVFSSNVKEKKQQFFNYMVPIAKEANSTIKKSREQILLLKRHQTRLNQSQKNWLEKIAKDYRLSHWDVTKDSSWHKLLNRVDIIPISLLLAQSANESAWGSSRFAKQGNNLFGQWCFTKGCGIVPNRRNAGSSHEVRAFGSVADSVKAYMNNLNTNSNYKLLRKLRAALRSKNLTINGNQLAAGLIKYSQRKQEYIKELRQMISFNKLEKYDA